MKLEKPLFILVLLIAAYIGWNYDIFGIWPKTRTPPAATATCKCYVCTDTYCKVCSCKGKACGDEGCPSPRGKR